MAVSANGFQNEGKLQADQNEDQSVEHKGKGLPEGPDLDANRGREHIGATVSQEQSAGHHCQHAGSMDGVREKVRGVGHQDAERYLDGAIVNALFHVIDDPADEQAQMRVLLRKYSGAVAGPEWDSAIRTGSATEGARDALNDMYRVLGSEESSVASSPISQKFLDQLGTLASERNQRILDAKPQIPGLLWTGLLFGGVVLLGLGGFMRLGSIRAHLLLLGAVAVLLGLLLFIVFWLDHPFGNQLGVTPAPFEQSLSVFDSIDRGT